MAEPALLDLRPLRPDVTDASTLIVAMHREFDQLNEDNARLRGDNEFLESQVDACWDRITVLEGQLAERG